MEKAHPLHERGDVFAAIAEAAEHKDSSAYDQNIVEAKFHGALMMLLGTDIPKGHDVLSGSIVESAWTIDLQSDPLVLQALEWIELEKKRHAKKARPDLVPPQEPAYGFQG